MDEGMENAARNDTHRLDWKQQSSGAWFGSSGDMDVGIVATAIGGGFEWRLRVPPGPATSTAGLCQDPEAALRAADAAWTAWTRAHGLVPAAGPAESLEATGPDAAKDFALEAYRRQVRSVVERGYSEAYTAALVATVVAAYDGYGETVHRIEETDAIFHGFYLAEKQAIDEARAGWGSLLEADEAVPSNDGGEQGELP